MPIYEYACRQCQHQFETLVRSDSTPSCPQCQSQDLEKLLSVFATGAGQPEAAPMAACPGCAHPGGPGACAMMPH